MTCAAWSQTHSSESSQGSWFPCPPAVRAQRGVYEIYSSQLEQKSCLGSLRKEGLILPNRLWSIMVKKAWQQEVEPRGSRVQWI